MSEEKCPFLYDDCQCSIPEGGEPCPEVFDFKNEDGTDAKCEHQMVVLTRAEAKALHLGLLSQMLGKSLFLLDANHIEELSSALEKIQGGTLREHVIGNNP